MNLDGIPIGTLGPAGLLALAILLILMGRLIPRPTYEDMRQERDKWQQAHTISEEARRLEAASNHELLELARTTAQFIQALPRPPSDTT